MKKLLIAGIITALMLAFAGCASKAAPVEPAPIEAEVDAEVDAEAEVDVEVVDVEAEI